MTKKEFKESILKKIRERKDEMVANAKICHEARQYEMEKDYLSRSSALSEALCVIVSEE